MNEVNAAMNECVNAAMNVVNGVHCFTALVPLQGASKGAAVDRILKKLSDERNAPDFVLCIGDDRSDEDMFTAMEHVTFSPHLTTEVCHMLI